MLNLIKISPDEAIHFLQLNRNLRQIHSEVNLQFVYTGSIGLGNVVKKLGQLDLINDLTRVEIPPLTKPEALMLIDRLVLGLHEEGIDIEPKAKTKNYLLGRLQYTA